MQQQMYALITVVSLVLVACTFVTRSFLFQTVVNRVRLTIAEIQFKFHLIDFLD